MPTEVLYRKWRPQCFADVAGQDVIKRTLINSLVAHKVSHAYLFSGPRGTGKTTMGRLLAKAVNCERNASDAADSPGEPCNECASCLAYTHGRALDLIELDAASNRGIEEVRELREKANFAPSAGAGAHKLYLIDEVHMLTDPAFNALLKIVEEPPRHIIFVLATTDAHKVPATIVSRCQRHDFKRIPLEAIVGRLAYIAGEEGIEVARDGLDLIARHATGSLRDAINLLEQICDSYGGTPSLEAVRESLGLIGDERAVQLALQALRGDLALGIATIGGVRDDGLDLRQFQRQVVSHLRELLIAQSGADTAGALTAEQAAERRSAADGVPREKLIRVLKLFSEADLRADPLSPLPLELALAESTLSPPAPAQREDQDGAGRRPAPVQAQQRPPARTAPGRPPESRPPPPRPRETPPPELRKSEIENASAEQIASMLGSKAPVIPPAGEEPADGASNVVPLRDGAPAAPDDLLTLVTRMYAHVKRNDIKVAAYLNGSCHAVSWQDGVLTLGCYTDLHKTKIEEYRKTFDEAASALLAAPASIRCIMAARPAKQLSKSPIVQHAVQNLGAKIVSEE